MPESSCRHCGWYSAEKAVETCPECGSKVTSWGREESIPAVSQPQVVAQEGMRVRVWSHNQEENWGIGTIIRCNVGGHITQIHLDHWPDGRLIDDQECYWCPVTKEMVLDLVKRAIARRRKITLAGVVDDYICPIPVAIFYQITADVLGVNDVEVYIDKDECLTVKELSDMIWDYIK